jgi:hypothetical protein
MAILLARLSPCPLRIISVRMWQPRRAPPTRGASTCSTRPSGLAARHQAPVRPVGTRSRGSQRWPGRRGRATQALPVSLLLTRPKGMQYAGIFSMPTQASIMASATSAASAPRHSTVALGARSLRGRRRDAEGSQVAETVSEAHDLPLRFSHGRHDGRIHALGCCHIGEAAYFVWALPPNIGGTAQRHVQVHPHTTSLRTMAKRLRSIYRRL